MVLDRGAVSVVSLVDGSVEHGDTYTADTPEQAIRQAFTHVRGSDQVQVVNLAPVTQTVRIPMTLDLLATDRFVQVASRAFTSAQAVGTLSALEDPVISGLLADPGAVTEGALTYALALRTSRAGVNRLAGWIPSEFRSTAFPTVPAVGASVPASGVGVIISRGSVHVWACVNFQPVEFKVVSTVGLEDVAGRLGVDGWKRVEAMWVGGRGDPVAVFELRTLMTSIVHAVVRVKARLHVDGFAVGETVDVACELGPSPLLATIATEHGLTVAPPADAVVAPGLQFAYRVAAAGTRFGTSRRWDCP